VSETAQTLIKAALRVLGAIASGETPTADEMADGLSALRMMLRNWSSQNIRLFYTDQDIVTLTGASYYTIGSGGTVNTTRPTTIRGARTADGIVDVIGEDRYRELVAGGSGGTVAYLWYSPEYPLGLLYPWPLTSDTLYLDSLKPLADPTAITTSIAFPPEYDDAIKYNLAVRLAPEYVKEPSPTVSMLALNTLHNLETVNFANRMNTSKVDVISIPSTYSIEYG